MNDQSRFIAKPLPVTVADLVNQRKGKFARNLNDIVEELYLKLWDNEKFKDYLAAVDDGETVEGSMSCDDHEAARMLRDLARQENIVTAKDRPLASFKMALKVVMVRYEMTRKLRRIKLGGELVRGSSEED